MACIQFRPPPSTPPLDVVFTEERQDEASVGLVATGTVETITYDAAGEEQADQRAIRQDLRLRPEVGDRWPLVEVEDG